MLRWLVLFTCIHQAALTAADTISSAASPANITLPGHSLHGEAFDEGPRRAATLLGNTGQVFFAISTRQPLVQQFFNQGIGQLHGFWYFEAERSFRQAAKLDPECAMTYFGMALANTNNEARAKGFIAEAVKRKEGATDREKRYIKAIDDWYQVDIGDKNKAKLKERAQNYVKALEEIIYLYPDDIEAKAMLGLTLWQKRDDLGLNSLFAVDALLNDVLAANQFHPVHHYRIHLWDNDKAKLAINSAERCGLSAPGIAHMWHMSGHTYSELNQYFDALWYQEASARTDHAYMMRDGIFPDRIHNFAHNNDWLVKNLQYVGRVHDAITLAHNSVSLPRHPKLNAFPGDKKSAHFGRAGLIQIYSHFELWDRLIAESQTQILCPTTDEIEQIKYFRHLGRAYYRRNETALGKVQLALLERRLNRLKQDNEIAIDNATAKARFDGKDAKAIENQRKEIIKSTSARMELLEKSIDELQGYQFKSEGKFAEALARFEKSKDVDDTLVAEVEFLTGKKDEALTRLRERVNRSKNQVRPLAALVEMLWRQDKKDESRQVFEKLRDISGNVDRDLPPFARLDPIAIEFGFPIDWRKPKPVARNVAELPDLSTLGPFTWHPSSAPDWSLPDADGQLRSLADYRGKPVVIIFYLGEGCLHCVEQLQAFAAKQKAYADAGMSLIAVTTETPQILKKSLQKYRSESGFPYQLVSDATLATFKKWLVTRLCG